MTARATDQCHCCGGVPDIHDTVPRYCHTCRTGCRLVAIGKILRGAGCPFLVSRGKTPPVLVVDAPARGSGGESTPAQKATGSRMADSFEWRGRVRRNVPGG